MFGVRPILVSQYLLILVGLTFAWISVAGDRGPVIPKGKGEQCVAETNFMRRNHMDLIIHQRDDTVIRGIRDEPFSLVECVDCHAQQDDNGQSIRVDADEQFCASCHSFAAVKIDCFGCHAAVPDADRQESVDAEPWLPNKQHLAAFQRKSLNELPIKLPSEFPTESQKEVSNKLPTKLQKMVPSNLPTNLQKDVHGHLPTQFQDKVPNKVTSHLKGKLPKKLPGEISVDSPHHSVR